MRTETWMLATLAIAGCDDTPPVAIHSPPLADAPVAGSPVEIEGVPSLFGSEPTDEPFPFASGAHYHTDEAGELWATTRLGNGFSAAWQLFRFDRATNAWGTIDRGGLDVSAFGSSGDGKLLVGLQHNPLVVDYVPGVDWYYLAPGATTLGAPLATMTDVDGGGTNDIGRYAAMDAAGRLYVYMATPGQEFIGRFEPGAPSFVENVLDLSTDEDAVGHPVAAPDGSIYVVHQEAPKRSVVDRFAPDGSGPTRVLSSCNGCPPVGEDWEWSPSGVGYSIAGAGQVYQLKPDGSYTLFADSPGDDYAHVEGLSYLADGSVLGFFQNDSRDHGGLFVGAGDADSSTAWTQLADWSFLQFRPIPGHVGEHRWVTDTKGYYNRAYELIIE